MAFGGSYVCIVNIVPGILERRTDIYGHVRMGVFLGIGPPLMSRMEHRSLSDESSRLRLGVNVDMRTLPLHSPALAPRPRRLMLIVYCCLGTVRCLPPTSSSK